MYCRLDTIECMLQQLIEQGQQIMSDTSGLTASLAALHDEVGAIGTQMDANFQALMTAIASGDQAAIDAAKAAIDADVQALKDIGARDTFPVPPVPAP
jgi:hypothetical protein